MFITKIRRCRQIIWRSSSSYTLNIQVMAIIMKEEIEICSHLLQLQVELQDQELGVYQVQEMKDKVTIFHGTLAQE